MTVALIICLLASAVSAAFAVRAVWLVGQIVNKNKKPKGQWLRH